MEPLDAAAAAELRRQADACLFDRDGDAAFFAPGFLRDRAFCCVPFQGDFHDAGEPVARLCTMAGIASLQCGSVPAGFEVCRAVAPRHDDLALVRRTYVCPSYFITDMFETFALVSDSDYFWAVAAPKPLLERMFAEPLPSIIAAFREDFAPYRDSGESHDRYIGAMMDEFAAICTASILARS